MTTKTFNVYVMPRGSLNAKIGTVQAAGETEAMIQAIRKFGKPGARKQHSPLSEIYTDDHFSVRRVKP